MRKEFPIAFRMKCCIAGLALEKWNLNSATEAWFALDDRLVFLQDAIKRRNVSPPPGPPPELGTAYAVKFFWLLNMSEHMPLLKVAKS